MLSLWTTRNTAHPPVRLHNNVMGQCQSSGASAKNEASESGQNPGTSAEDGPGQGSLLRKALNEAKEKNEEAARNRTGFSAFIRDFESSTQVEQQLLYCTGAMAVLSTEVSRAPEEGGCQQGSHAREALKP